MIPLSILDEAEQELWQAILYYEDKAPGLGLDLQLEAEAATHLIQRFPEMWPLREDGTRRHLMTRFPYLVVYLYEDEQVWVVAFAHCKRKPGYWLSRIDD